MPFISQQNKYVYAAYEVLAALEKNPRDAGAKAAAKRLKISYIYIGDRNPLRDGLTASELSAAGYKRVYRAGGVSIFAVN
jgi:hypothetical protein